MLSPKKGFSPLKWLLLVGATYILRCQVRYLILFIIDIEFFVKISVGSKNSEKSHPLLKKFLEPWIHRDPPGRYFFGQQPNLKWPKNWNLTLKARKVASQIFLTPTHTLKNGAKLGQKIGYFQTAPLMETTALFQGMLVNQSIGKGRWMV